MWPTCMTYAAPSFLLHWDWFSAKKRTPAPPPPGGIAAPRRNAPQPAAGWPANLTKLTPLPPRSLCCSDVQLSACAVVASGGTQFVSLDFSEIGLLQNERGVRFLTSPNSTFKSRHVIQQHREIASGFTEAKKQNPKTGDHMAPSAPTTRAPAPENRQRPPGLVGSVRAFASNSAAGRRSSSKRRQGHEAEGCHGFSASSLGLFDPGEGG